MLDLNPETASLVDRLAQHAALGAAPLAELEWLAAHGDFRRYTQGARVIEFGDPTDEMIVVLSGQIDTWLDRGNGPRKMMQWRAGEITGPLPYSRGTNAPVQANAELDSEIVAVHTRHFPEMIRECHTITTICVRQMVDRARKFTTRDLEEEKVMSLGRLAAGLAHELNNPASAAARGAELIAEALNEFGAASRELGALRLNEAQVAAVEAVVLACATLAPASASALDAGVREEAICEWLDARGVDTAYAGSLADSCVTIQLLDALAAAVGEDALRTTIRCIAAEGSTRQLAAEVAAATSRIHDLVAAVKRFTFMDRPIEPEPISLAQGLRDAVTLLETRANARSIDVILEIEPDLPPVRVAGGHINQVWTSLIDNALDASPQGGRVRVVAERGYGSVLVRVIDEGPGVPPEIGSRIFDPFFTTKEVGQGTGLGLDIARRVVREFAGDIKFESLPGRTEFVVRLPTETDA